MTVCFRGKKPEWMTNEKTTLIQKEPQFQTTVDQ